MVIYKQASQTNKKGKQMNIHHNFLQNKTECRTLGEFVDFAKEQLFDCLSKEERVAAISQILEMVKTDLEGVHNETN